MESRPYQKECIDIINQSKEGRHLVALATGLGKTYIFTHIARKGRTLILSHRDELVRQPERYYDCTFGVEKADEYATDEEVVSASVQTLSNDQRLRRFKEDEFHTIIIDEAHHAAAPSYRKILNYFSGAKYILGVTATPKRGDGVRLTDVFDDILFSRDLPWGIRNGYLSNIVCNIVVGKYTLKGIKKSLGDFQIAEIAGRINAETIAIAAKAYLDNCHKKGRHTLIYCVNTNTCRVLCETIRSLLPEKEKESICVVTGKSTDRKERIDDFSKGKIRCIINCMVLTEGTDLPICDAVMNLRPTCNNSLYQQMVGRGTRLYEGKKNCLVLDVVPEEGVTRDLCVAPTLFGLDINQLDSATQQQIKNGEDILSISDALIAACTEMTKIMEVRLSAVKSYIKDCSKILTECREEGFHYLADRYKELKEGSEIVPEMSELCVELEADEGHYYKITPNFTDTIYISKPDVLDNVSVEFHVSSEQFSKNGKSVFIGHMKLQDAVELAKKYCRLMPDYYGYKWDKEKQKEWSRLPATEKQISKIVSDYKAYQIPRNTADDLDRLEANRIIDFKSELDNKKQFAKIYSDSVDTKKKNDVQKIEQFKKLIEKEKSEKEDALERFGKFEETVEAAYGQKEEKEKKQAEMLEKGCICIKSTCMATNIDAATDRQIAFVKSLIDKAKKNNFFLEEDIDFDQMGKTEVSILIDLFKSLQKQPYRVVIEKGGIEKALREARGNRKERRSVENKYTIRIEDVQNEKNGEA